MCLLWLLGAIQSLFSHVARTRMEEKEEEDQKRASSFLCLAQRQRSVPYHIEAGDEIVR